MFLGGRIVSQGFTFNCRIRNRHEAGAQVQLESADVLPATSFLIDTKVGWAFPSRLAWQRGTAAGLEFSGAVDLRSPDLTPELRSLRQIWLAVSQLGMAT